MFGEENKGEQSSSSSAIHTDSDSDSLGDEISSMHSDLAPQVRRFGLKSNHKDSFSSSEMERNFSDDGLSLPKLESGMQTDPFHAKTDFASQTEISHNGKTFLCFK